MMQLEQMNNIFWIVWKLDFARDLIQLNCNSLFIRLGSKRLRRKVSFRARLLVKQTLKTALVDP